MLLGFQVAEDRGALPLGFRDFSWCRWCASLLALWRLDGASTVFWPLVPFKKEPSGQKGRQTKTKRSLVLKVFRDHFVQHVACGSKQDTLKIPLVEGKGVSKNGCSPMVAPFDAQQDMTAAHSTLRP